MSGTNSDNVNIHLAKRPSVHVVAAAKLHKMDGWARSAAKDLDDPDAPMFAIENDKREIIGQAGLKIWPAGSSRAMATIALFDPNYRGRGIGTLAMRMVLAHAFLDLGLPRVMISADGDNIAARRCYSKAGFATMKVGEDERVYMEALRERWLERHSLTWGHNHRIQRTDGR